LIGWWSASNFSAIFRTRTFKNLNATGLETRKGDGYGRIILPVQQVSYGPLVTSIMLIMSCYSGFFNVRRGWQSLNTGPRFYLRLVCRTGWLWISTSRTTDGRPFKPKNSRSHFYTESFFGLKGRPWDVKFTTNPSCGWDARWRTQCNSSWWVVHKRPVALAKSLGIKTITCSTCSLWRTHKMAIYLKYINKWKKLEPNGLKLQYRCQDVKC
jgi:hypothetical protein